MKTDFRKHSCSRSDHAEVRCPTCHRKIRCTQTFCSECVVAIQLYAAGCRLLRPLMIFANIAKMSDKERSRYIYRLMNKLNKLKSENEK